MKFKEFWLLQTVLIELAWITLCLVKVASTAVVTKCLGGNTDQIMDAVSQAWVDGQSLRTYRHAPNAGSRKSWAAGDATSRAVRLASNDYSFWRNGLSKCFVSSNMGL